MPVDLELDLKVRDKSVNGMRSLCDLRLTAEARLALLFATLAIPMRLDGKWITTAWAIEGAILIWTGFNVRMIFLREAGGLLFILAAARLLTLSIPANAFLLNARFGTAMAVLASFVAALIGANRQGSDLDG